MRLETKSINRKDVEMKGFNFGDLRPSAAEALTPDLCLLWPSMFDNS